MEIQNVLVIGTGAWGTAIAQVLADNGKNVILYGIDCKEVKDINENHKNSKYFPDVVLSDKIEATTTFFCCFHTRPLPDMIILAIPTQAMQDTVRELFKDYNRDFLPMNSQKQVVFVNLAKGYSNEDVPMLDTFIQNSYYTTTGNRCKYYSLLGPSHAEEVIKRRLTCVNLIGFPDNAYSSSVVEAFNNDYFKVEVEGNISIAEFCSSIKNVYALASGILDGLGYGQNARAALITFALHEMRRFIKEVFKKDSDEDLFNLYGIGDLIVTCYSTDSRNFTAGREIGKLNSFVEFEKSNTRTVEGIRGQNTTS